MSKGAVFGADDLAIGDHEDCPFAAVALTFVEVLVLERVTIEDLLHDFPEGREAFARARRFYRAQHAFRRFAHKAREKEMNSRTVFGYSPKRQRSTRRLSRPPDIEGHVGFESTGSVLRATSIDAASAPALQQMAAVSEVQLGAVLDAIKGVAATNAAQNAATTSAIEHLKTEMADMRCEINAKLDRQLLQMQFGVPEKEGSAN